MINKKNSKIPGIRSATLRKILIPHDTQIYIIRIFNCLKYKIFGIAK